MVWFGYSLLINVPSVTFEMNFGACGGRIEIFEQ